MIGSIKLLTGTSNQNLAKEVSEYLNIPLSDAIVSRFSDGE
ncbi:ribose-phosphate pyrophosphokinase-like domain-containing protein, partial [Thermocrinis sp.]